MPISIKKFYNGRRIFFLLPLFLIFSLIIFFLLFEIFFPFPYDKIERDRSTIIFFSDESIARIFLTEDDKYRIWLEEEDIPDIIKEAFLSAEDRYFYYHLGINPFSIINAFYHNIKNRRIVSGASTITMQLARMAEPKRRTLFNKLFEVFRAVQIELRYSKNEILALYLNSLPFGSNIEGIETASLIYFQKNIENLNPGEIAILTTVPRAPNAHNPLTGNRKRIKESRNRALRLMLKNKIIEKDIYDIALKTPIPERPPGLPFLIPHISEYLYYTRQKRGRIHTTIDKSTQSFLERVSNNYINNLTGYGINNLSVMIVCNKTNSVISAIGSQDYFEEETGQIIGFNAKRSPGSLLKPFLYAKAIEEGLINSQTLLEDTPVYYSDYEPTNYGGIFTGISTAKNALCDSLNIPAIKLLEKIGPNIFLNLLRNLGYRIPKSHDHYGLSMILGSAEITLLEAMSSFLCLAEEGELKRIHFTQNRGNDHIRNVFDKGTAYLISDMLKDHSHSSLDNHLPYDISWKTGTSYRFRDAWAVGYNPRYTVGVWTGNFSGPVPPMNTGHNTAAPLMFMIFNHLMRNQTNIWFDKPDNLLEIDICSLSGMLPSKNCPHIKKTLVLSARVPMDRCRYHISLPVDENGYIVSNKRDAVDYKVFIDFPPEVRSWLHLNKRLSFELPRYSRDDNQKHDPPMILFPQNNQVFELIHDSNTIPLKIAPNPHTEYNYLFINDKYKKRFPNSPQINISPSRGELAIYLSDDFGNTSNTIYITVK